MSRVRIIAIFVLLAAAIAAAQNGNNPVVNSLTFPVFTLNPDPVPGASISIVGQPGQATWYFWASANYQLGSVISPIGAIANAPNTLSGGNYVSITPYAYPAGALTVDILATTGPLQPVGACNCAVATGLTSGGVNFQSNSLSSYTVSILNPQAFNLKLTNEVTGTGATSLLLRNAYTGALVCNLSTGCGSGGGVPTGVANGSALVSNGVSVPPVYQVKPTADTADYPAIVGDGSTDVCSSFQAFINANPGKHLNARKVGAAVQGGAAVSTIDYYSSCTLHLTYNGTILDGNVNETWQGAPVFLFAAGVTGFQIDPSCYGCEIRNIEQIGGGKPAFNNTACYTASRALVFPFTGAADGVLVYGGEPIVTNVIAQCNPRDGVHIDGTNVSQGGFLGQPDSWTVTGGQGNANLHNGLYVHGGDSQAGNETKFMAYNDGGWGAEDDANVSNSHRNTFTTSDGNDPAIAAKATSALSSISCSSFACSVVAATPVASIQNGIWIVIAGTTNYNGVYYVTGFTDSQHFSFTWVAPSHATETSGTVGVDGSTHMFANAIRSTADASCASGQALLFSQSAQFGMDTQVGAVISVAGAGAAGALLTTTIASIQNEYTATLAANCSTTVTNAQISYGGGISHGSIMANGGATWTTPYWESEPCARILYQGSVTGGNLCFDYTFNQGKFSSQTPLQVSGGHLTTQYLILHTPLDIEGDSEVWCGTTVIPTCGITLEDYLTNGTTTYWFLGFTGASGAQFQITDRIPVTPFVGFDMNHNGTTDLYGATDITLNPASGHTVKISTALSLNGQTNTYSSGAGAPSGSCATGSLYTNSSAASASTVLYVCGPANTWTAVTAP